MAEAPDLKSVQCQFESDLGHHEAACTNAKLRVVVPLCGERYKDVTVFAYF